MTWEGTSLLGFRYSDEMDMGEGASGGMLTATEVACSGDFMFMRRAGKELWTKMTVPPQALLAFIFILYNDEFHNLSVTHNIPERKHVCVLFIKNAYGMSRRYVILKNVGLRDNPISERKLLILPLSLIHISEPTRPY